MRSIRWMAAAAVTIAAAVGFQSAAHAAHASTATASTVTASTAKPSYQLGIDLDFYWYRNMKVANYITAEAKYARALGANAIMISFPFYSSSRVPTAGASTPSPAILALAIRTARAQGVQVGVRPLLDQHNLGGARVGFVPKNVAAWLCAYAKLLAPYATAAQQAGANRFWMAAELTQFAHNAGWADVTRAIKARFKGTVYFAANWVTANDTRLLPGSGGPGVTVGADAYPTMPYPLSQLKARWASRALGLPKGTVLSEVGIEALAGAQYKPYISSPSTAPLVPAVQVDWFNAACNAVAVDHLGGVYFWSINVGDSLTVKPTSKTPTKFTDAPGATAIKACFARLKALHAAAPGTYGRGRGRACG
jgi:hypothetical protein